MVDKFCCETLVLNLKEKRTYIGYNEVFREIYLNRSDTRSVITVIFFCPWCGSKLPNSLRDKFFDTLEKEYNIETDIGEYKERKDIPAEFKGGEWWKKRDL